MSHFYPWGYWFLKSGGGVELEIKKQVFIILFRPFSSFFFILTSSWPHPCLILFHSFSYSPILWLKKSFSNERFIMSRVVFAINIVLRYPWNLYIVQQVIVVIWKIHPAFLLTISRSWVWKVSYLFRGK